MDQYVIRVEGPLPDDALAGFTELSVRPQTVQTVLHGRLQDQAALAGILDHLNELGVEIVEVLKVPADERRSGVEEPPGGHFG